MLTALLCAAVLAHAPAADPVTAPTPALSTDWHYYSPGGLSSVRVDVAFAAELGVYGIAWARLTGAGDTLICFSTALPTGAPNSAPIVVASLPPGVELTAGVALTDTLHGSEFLVAWASAAPASRAFTARIAPAGSTFSVSSTHVTAFSNRVYSLDIGASEGAGAVLVGSAGGQVFAEQLFITTLSSALGSYGPNWIPRPPGATDQAATIARSDEVLIAWERYEGEGASIWGRSGAITQDLDPDESVLLIESPGGFAVRPCIAGSGETAAVVALSHDGGITSVLGVEVDAPFQAACGGSCPDQATTIVEFEPHAWFSDPTIGEVDGDRWVACWNADVDGVLTIAGVGLGAGGLEPLEDPFVVSKDEPTAAPRVSDNPLVGAHTALIGWAGPHPSFPSTETRGAIVRAGEL